MARATSNILSLLGYQSDKVCLHGWWIIFINFCSFFSSTIWLAFLSYDLVGFLDLSLAHDKLVYYVFNTMLLMLLVFHIYWWVLIYSMIMKQMRNRGRVGEDIRSGKLFTLKILQLNLEREWKIQIRGRRSPSMSMVALKRLWTPVPSLLFLLQLLWA